MQPDGRAGPAKEVRESPAAGVIRIGGRDILVPLSLAAPDRARVRRAGARWLEGATERVSPRSVGYLSVLAVVWIILVIQPGIDLFARAVILALGAPFVAHVALQIKGHSDRQRDDAELRARVIIPDRDLHPQYQPVMRDVVDAVLRVAMSRSAREGHLGDGLALLAGEQWRIASALAQLAEARKLLSATGGGLPDQVSAVQAAEDAIDRRVQTIYGYAEAVKRVEESLLAVDAAVQSDAVHDRIRGALAALGDDDVSADLMRGVGDASTSVEAALEALRGQADALRALSAERPERGTEASPDR
ncbi:hypothetical protein [Actinopolymorpha pittospori]|uniref:Uncharacterized protein n=1 Tax=Actinopolymorpha pittospori TaxID=648752 RepID=A0A927RII1_9ACTN|nr:hypothetical protein [Actinopolymorpha pittospori]MBE1606211.1 hypothetical protein [Actinopolymorpha pittospori]